MIFRYRVRQDETRRTVDLGHSSDGPSWIDLAEIRVTTTESRFAACLNRLLQQNLPGSDMLAKARIRANAQWSFVCVRKRPSAVNLSRMARDKQAAIVATAARAAPIA